MANDITKQKIVKYIQNEYGRNWQNMPAQAPLFEVRVSLKTIISTCTFFNLTFKELYDILEEIVIPYK